MPKKTAPRLSNVVKLPLGRSSPDIAKLLLETQSAPKVAAVPQELRDAIDRRARELAEQAYNLCHEHLRRRVAYECEHGYPERVLNVDKAFAVIEEGDLGDALVREFHQKLAWVRRDAAYIAERIQQLVCELDSVQTAKRR